MPQRFASRLEGVRISMIRQIMLKAQGCINLGLGEADFGAPETVRAEAHRVLEEEKIGYSPNLGLASLCKEIVHYHGNVTGHRACVTNGSQEGLFDLLFALVDEGDQVLVPDPGFVAYPTIVRMAGGTPVGYPLRPENDFQLDPTDIESQLAENTKVIMVLSPSNPTGQCVTREQMEWLSRLARERGIVIVSDEIYREIYYTEEKPSTIADVSEYAVILSGVSKMASMTGWRVGWVCGPKEIIEKVTVMHQYTSSCASTLSQRAASKIFTPEGRTAIEKQRQLLKSNCDLLCEWIETEMDRPYIRPQGAFYLMLSVGDLKQDSFEISMELLQDGVATIPGSAFGERGEGFLRLSFACDPIQIAEGMSRVKLGLDRLSG